MAAINQGNNSFTCLDQSKTISLSSLNDGNCDCPDGSDEPGTNACINGHFYCRNIGGKPKLIPSHKVNDGVYDCCDGSDEADNANLQCSKVCSKLVEMSHNSRELIYSKIRAGIKMREESIKETQSDYHRSRKEMKDLRQEFARLEHELDILNLKKKEKQKIWKIHKRQMDGISEEKYAELKLRKKEYIYKPPKQRPVYSEPDPYGINVPFNRDINSLDWNVYEQIENEIFHATPTPIADYLKSENKDQIDQNRIEKRKRKWNQMQLHENEEMNTKNTLSFVGKLRNSIKELLTKTFDCNQPESLKELKEVEKEINELNNVLSDIRVAIYKLEKKFKHDLGEDNVWWPITGQSFEFSKDGNDYQLTIFEHLLQRQSGSFWFGNAYGTFHGFDPTNRTMLYEEGQLCWEGPPRRTEVLFYCGSVNKFIDMEEIDRCVYRAHFETPLCCNDGYFDWIKNMTDLELSEYISQWMEVE